MMLVLAALALLGVVATLRLLATDSPRRIPTRDGR